MNVDLGVEGTLVVQNVLHERYIESTCGDIGAHEDCTVATGRACLALLHGRLEAIQVLQSLSLLHLRMQGPLVGHLQECQQGRETPDACDRVAEDYSRVIVVVT